MKKVEPMIMVDRVVDSIVQAAAEGRFLPGDRLKEADIGQLLGISRVPVREALLILEGQRLVECRPYKGFRMSEFDKSKLEDVAIVRNNLETLALDIVFSQAQERSRLVVRLQDILRQLKSAIELKDVFGIAKADVEFHRQICAATRNEALIQVWESLAVRVLVTLGICLRRFDYSYIHNSHEQLLHVIAEGDRASCLDAMNAHILNDFNNADYDAAIMELRAGR